MTTNNDTYSPETASFSVIDLKAEHLRNALVIGTPSPRLSWSVLAASKDWVQTAYEIAVERASFGGEKATGKIISGNSVLNTWPFEPLRSREFASVRVRVWGPEDGSPSPWSSPLSLEAGLFEPECWTARFISPEIRHDGEKPRPGLLLRREFLVRPYVRKARLYATAHGLYAAELNGVPVDDQLFAPGWTSYSHRLRYQSFDVTDLLREGANALGSVVGEGWYLGRFGYNGGRRDIYGNRIAFLAQLEIEYRDGSIETVVTDTSWRSAPGPILSSGIYDGEEYDARMDLPGWSQPGFDDRAWAPVALVERDLSTLFAPSGPTVRRTQTVKAVSVFPSPSGRTIVDFGQNIVGRIRIRVNGQAGHQIVFRHAEVLEHGELCTRPLRYAKATDRYIMKGSGTETWEPLFTFHGFRYVEVEDWPGTLGTEDIEAVVCHSDLERTGWFDCSDPLINKLHENIVWSMRGNFLDIPTDCPQRDERLGWTADIQIFSPTACFLYDSAGFLASWLADLAVEQRSDGAVPYFVPNINTGPIVPSAAWGDASVIVPWVLYNSYGDPGILYSQFHSMRAWVDHIESLAGENLIWENGFQFGDWLDPTSPPERPGDSRTDPTLIATAYFARSADLVSRCAGILGRAADAKHYEDLASHIREAFKREFVSPNGRLISDSATAYSLALKFGLLTTPEQRSHAGETLARLVREHGYRISTGFVGTPLICDALCEVGEYETAFKLLTQRACPSWLYPITMGATTSWERWDSMLPDGTVNPGDTTSFNHYALGAIADWLYRTVGGLAPLEAGYRKIEIKPKIGGGLTRASSQLKTPYGMAECSWMIDGEKITVKVQIPPNASARISLPRSSEAPFKRGSGTYTWIYDGEPESSRPITLDSTLSEFFADPSIFAGVVARVPELACLSTITQISSATTLSQQIDFIPNGEPLKKALAAALAELDKGSR